MSQLALDKVTNDLFKPVGGGVTRVTDGRFVIQQVQSKLKTILGEWLLDSNVGWVNEKDFDRNYDLFDIENRARSIILSTQGVLNIINLTSTYNSRVLEIQFSARTIHGTIDITVPWNNIGV